MTTHTRPPRQSLGFSLDDAARIRRMMRERAAALACPNCGERLHPTGGGDGERRVWLVRCDGCGSSVMLHDSP